MAKPYPDEKYESKIDKIHSRICHDNGNKTTIEDLLNL